MVLTAMALLIARLTLLVLAAGPLLGTAQQRPPPAPPMPSLDDASVAVVNSGPELAIALADPAKSFALLNTSISVSETDFSTLIIRTSNFTISGRPGPQTLWPVLELGFVKGKVSRHLFDAAPCLWYTHGLFSTRFTGMDIGLSHLKS